MTSGRPKILHVAPTPFFSDRGCHIRIAGLVRALQAAGLENVICTYHHGRDVGGLTIKRIRPVPGYRRTAAGPDWHKYWADWRLIWLVWRSLRRERPDVIHAHLHEGVLVGWIARLLSGRWRIPLVFDAQGSLTGELAAFGYFRWRWVYHLFRRVEGWVARLPCAVACSSPQVRDILVNRFGVPSHRLWVVSDAADPALPPDPVGVPTALRNRLRPTGSEWVVVYSGSLLPGKGVYQLHDIIINCSKRLPAARFLVIGYPTEPTKRFLKENRLEDRCVLVGRLPYERLAGFLALADAALDPKPPGSGEASGKILHYMWAGLPVACCDSENNRALLGQDGFFASHCDGEALLEELCRMQAQPAAARAAGARGRERARSRFTWERSAAKLREIYNNCLAASGG